jgi:hypothetical protein
LPPSAQDAWLRYIIVIDIDEHLAEDVLSYDR